MSCPLFRRRTHRLGISALATVFALIGAQARAEPKSDDPCKLVVGRERPAGCAPRLQRKPVKAPPERKRSTGPRTPALALRPAPVSIERLTERRHQLLIAELGRLERLVEGTRPGSPDRAGLVRRLAEGYAELAAVAERQKIRAEVKASDAKKRVETAPRRHSAEGGERRRTRPRSETPRAAPKKPDSPYPRRL